MSLARQLYFCVHVAQIAQSAKETLHLLRVTLGMSAHSKGKGKSFLLYKQFDLRAFLFTIHYQAKHAKIGDSAPEPLTRATADHRGDIGDSILVDLKIRLPDGQVLIRYNSYRV